MTSAWPGELPSGMEMRAPTDWRKEVCSARTAAMALCSCAISRRNRMMMRRDGIMPLLARLMKSDSPLLLSPVVGIVKEFAKEVNKTIVKLSILLLAVNTVSVAVCYA